MLLHLTSSYILTDLDPPTVMRVCRAPHYDIISCIVLFCMLDAQHGFDLVDMWNPKILKKISSTMIKPKYILRQNTIPLFFCCFCF